MRRHGDVERLGAHRADADAVIQMRSGGVAGQSLEVALHCQAIALQFGSRMPLTHNVVAGAIGERRGRQPCLKAFGDSGRGA